MKTKLFAKLGLLLFMGLILGSCSKSEAPALQKASKPGNALKSASVVSGIYGGGPIYNNRTVSINELKSSGFTEVIVWNIFVNSSGDLNFNAEFPLVSGGSYIGSSKWPNFASDMTALKTAPTSVTRVTFCIGSSATGVFQAIRDLVNSQGTGSSSILYRNFQALKNAIPAVDAIDFDDENCYDTNSMVAFAVMLGNLGYKVSLCPYTNSGFWTNVASQVNSQRTGTIDMIHLQCYAGGGGNTPCSGWNFGNIPVYPGLWDADLNPSQVQSQMSSWKSSCNISGGWMWLYDDFVNNGKAAQYASAINTALSGGSSGSGTEVSLSSAFNLSHGMVTDGTTFASNGGLDGVGYAYSDNLLGSSVVWNNTSFSLGSPNTADAVTCAGQSITLPSGQYSYLRILATAENGNQASQALKVTYSDNSTTTFTQGFSDWYTPQGYSGESNAVAMAYRDSYSGSKDNRTFYLYGYSFSLSNTKTISKITLPNNSKVKILALTLVQ